MVVVTSQDSQPPAYLPSRRFTKSVFAVCVSLVRHLTNLIISRDPVCCVFLTLTLFLAWIKKSPKEVPPNIMKLLAGKPTSRDVRLTIHRTAATCSMWSPLPPPHHSRPIAPREVGSSTSGAPQPSPLRLLGPSVSRLLESKTLGRTAWLTCSASAIATFQDHLTGSVSHLAT